MFILYTSTSRVLFLLSVYLNLREWIILVFCHYFFYFFNKYLVCNFFIYNIIEYDFCSKFLCNKYLHFYNIRKILVITCYKYCISIGSFLNFDHVFRRIVCAPSAFEIGDLVRVEIAFVLFSSSTKRKNNGISVQAVLRTITLLDSTERNVRLQLPHFQY